MIWINNAGRASPNLQFLPPEMPPSVSNNQRTGRMDAPTRKVNVMRKANPANAWSQRSCSELLQRHPALKSLSGPQWEAALADSTLSRVLPECTPMGCRKGASDHFTIVLEGAVRVRSLSPEGRILGIGRVQAGEMCMLSLASIYSRERLLVDLSAEGNLLMLLIPAMHLPILLAHSEVFRSYLMTSISKQVTNLLGRIEESTFGCLKTRILSHLRHMRDSTGRSVVTISHQELAEEMGNTREAVSRTLKELERSGIVKLGRRSILLVDQVMPLASLDPRRVLEPSVRPIDSARGRLTPVPAPSKRTGR